MIPYDLPVAFMVIFMFLYGAVLGSFLTVCMHRLSGHEIERAQHWAAEFQPSSSWFLNDLRSLWPDWTSLWSAWRSLWHSPSHCDRCHQKLLARDNIPIFGWVILRGRCRFCKRSIPGRYPLIELTNGLLFVLVYLMEVPLGRWSPPDSSCLFSTMMPTNWSNALGLSPVAVVNARVVYHLILIEALFVASLIDWDLMIIPDSVTLPPMLLGIVGAATFAKLWLVPVWFQDPSVARMLFLWLPDGLRASWLTVRVPAWIADYPHWHGLAVSLAGLIVGGGSVWAVRIAGRIALRREAMGFGDVILMAMVGSFLGWQPVMVAFFVAPMIALLAVLLTRLFAWDREIPYGPYLSAGTLVTLLGWKWIFPAVERYFSLGPALLLIALVMTASLLPTLWLLRWIKSLLGFPDDGQGPFLDEWTSADQLSHFDGETVDRQQGQWRTKAWPGETTARGQSQWQQWLRPGPSDWRQHWSRRR